MEASSNPPFGIKNVERVAIYNNCLVGIFFLGTLIKMCTNYVAFVRYEPDRAVVDDQYYVATKFSFSLSLIILATLIIFYNICIYSQHGFGLTMVTFVLCCVLSPLCLGTGIVGVYELWDMIRDPQFFDKYFSQKFGNYTMDVIQSDLHCCGINKPVSRDTILRDSCCVSSKLRELHRCTLNLAWKDECSSALKRKILSVYGWVNYTLIGIGGLLIITLLIYYMLAMAIKYYYYY